MTQKTYNLPPIKFVGGESQTIKFHLQTISGESFNADGCHASFSLIQFTNHGGTPIVTKELSIGADPSGVWCYAVASLKPEDTSRLCGRYIYQVTVISADGTTEIPGQGYMDIVHNVNPGFVEQGGEQ